MTVSKDTTVSLIPFHFNGQEIPAIRDANGEPWWRAIDVCKQCDIKNVSQACERLDADEKADICLTDSAGRPQNVLIVNESGLYALVMRSRKAEAKAFRRWITHEVLPQIRKTGAYASPPRQLTTAEMLLEQAKVNVELERRQTALEAKMDALAERKPPEGKLRIEDWLRREAKPYLNKDLMRLLRAACNQRETPAVFRPEGIDWPLRYYTPATLDAAYEEVTRQLTLLTGRVDRDGNSTTHDTAVAYNLRRIRRRR